MTTRVYLLGGYQTDFADNWARNGMEIADMMRHTVLHGLAETKLEPQDIEVAHIGVPARHDHAVIAAAGAAIDRVDRRRHQRDVVPQPVRQRKAAGLRDEEVGRQPEVVEIAIRHVRAVRDIAQAGRVPVPGQALPPGPDRGPALRHVVHGDHCAHGEAAQNVTGLAAMVPDDCVPLSPIR